MTLTEFLRARIAEDEAAALSSVGRKWHAQGGPELRTIPQGSPGSVEPFWFQIARGGTDDGPDPIGDYVSSNRARLDTFHHIARHDPDRVLAECEAKRRIVALFPDAADGDGWNEAGAQVLELLALPYADHPDYREEWKP